MIYTGGFFDLLTPYTIVGGLTFLFVFLFHGTAFLTLRLAKSSLIMRCQQLALKTGVTAAIFFVLCMAMTLTYTDLFTKPLAAVALVGAALFFVMAILSMKLAKGKASFLLSTAAIVARPSLSSQDSSRASWSRASTRTGA